MMKKFAVLFAILMIASSADAGLLAYGLCQTGCNALVVSCYAVSQFVLLNFNQLIFSFLNRPAALHSAQ
jgi:hypothetical protein